jgi:hypothetical protein
MGASVLGEVRKCKALAKLSVRAEVERVVVRDSPERLSALAGVVDDVRQAGNIAEIRTVADGEFAVETILAQR